MQADWASSTELDEFRRWAGLQTRWPPDATLVRLLVDVLETRMHPIIVKDLLSKASLVQLATERFVTGARRELIHVCFQTLADGPVM